jgi:hypothetical protein
VRGSASITIFAVTILAGCGREPNQTQRELSSDSLSASTSVRDAVSASSAMTTLDTTAADLHPLGGSRDSSANVSGLECAPSAFSHRDTITLHMGHPHGEYLTVVGPDSATFFLISPDPAGPSEQVLMSSDAFIETPTIRFPADLRAKPAVYGRDTLEPVFKRLGQYVLTIGHKLETEHASQIHKCAIRFIAPK